MCLTLPLTIGSVNFSLPLCAATARALEQVLWRTDEAERAKTLLALLRIDPALTCFLVAGLLPDRRLSAPDLTELAQLAARSLAVLLGELEFPPSEDQPADNALPAARAVVRAEVVLRLAEEHGCVQPARFELAALVYGAATLATRTLPAENTPANLEQLFSNWLVQEIELPDVAAFASVAENLLATAEQLSQQPRSSDDEPPDGTTPLHASAELLRNCGQLASDVLQHWQQADVTAGEALIRLAHRLAPLEALQQEFATRLETEKLLAMKELAYGAGHEINNPLANISVRAQTLIKQESDPERRRMLAAINGQVYRAHEMIADLMLYAQPPKITPVPTPLQPLIERTIAGLLPDATRQHSTLRLLPSQSPLEAPVDPIQLALALHAMIVNSLEAMGQGGSIELQVRPQRAARGRQWAEISITDDGPGISDEVRRHLFDPFYSGREAGRGLGFGLSKCWRIVTAHGGRIEVESNLGRGACFTILLPT